MKGLRHPYPLIFLLGGGLIGFGLAAHAGAGGPEVRFVEGAGVFEVGPFSERAVAAMGAADGLGKVLSVRVAGENSERPEMSGAREWTGENFLRFVPRYPLMPGMSYEVRFLPEGIAESWRGEDWRKDVEVFAVAAREKEAPAKVTAIYPSGERLPENLLKFYIHFSRPMSRGEAYENVRLLDGKGVAIELPFLELGEELWDGQQRRFTLFFDPGRVKRGLKPNLEEGRPLRAGERYTLVVASSWKDAQRGELARTYEKSFEAVEADYLQPDPEAWELGVPAGGTRESLRVAFGEGLDEALLERVIWVEDGEGKRVPGKGIIGEGERSWNWEPEGEWEAGEYVLAVEPILEDLAGNSVGRPFEEHQGQPVWSKQRSGRPVRRAFAIGEKGSRTGG